jgi:hypothetical protein
MTHVHGNGGKVKRNHFSYTIGHTGAWVEWDAGSVTTEREFAFREALVAALRQFYATTPTEAKP